MVFNLQTRNNLVCNWFYFRYYINMTYEDMFDDMDKDTLIKDIDAFHKKFGFEKFVLFPT